jgi:regulator of nucleoside diphosphate kinase
MATTSRRILVTEDDMDRLKDLVHASRRSARRDQNHLAELDRELDRAEVVAATDVPADVVTMHSVVRVRDLDTGARVDYRLVFPADADIERHRISVLAPIGTALIGYRAGDRIEWTTPGGTRRLKVEAVLYQPETAAA